METYYPRIEIGIGIVLATAVLIWPNPPEVVKWAGLLSGVIFVLWGLRGWWKVQHATKQSVVRSQGWLPMWSLDIGDKWPVRRLISLAHAADRAMRKTDVASEAAKKLDVNPRAYMATAIVDDGNVPVFGFRDEWSRLVQIPPTEISSGSISEDCTALKFFGQDKPSYIGLCLKAADFRKRLREIKNWRL